MKIKFVLTGLFFLSFACQLVSQPGNNTTKVAIDRFRPISGSESNQVLEKSLPQIIRLSFINVSSIEFIDDGEINFENFSAEKSKFQANIQDGYKINKQELQKKTDVILFGDYSMTTAEIYIIPRMYDLRDGKIYTLKSVIVSDFTKNFSLSKFDPLAAVYRDKIRTIMKPGVEREKVGIVFTAEPLKELTAFEESMYRNIVIEVSKSADTISNVEVMNYEKLEPYYLNESAPAEIMKNLPVDLVYTFIFKKRSKYVIQVDLRLSFRKNKENYRIKGFTVDVLGSVDLTHELLCDFNNILKDIRTDNKLDPTPLHSAEIPDGEFEDLGDQYFEQGKYYLSGLMYNRALEIYTDSADISYFNYKIGKNFRQLKQPQRAILHFNRAISALPDDYYSWWEKGFAYYDDIRDYDKATDAFLEVEKINPDYAPGSLQYNIGITAFAAERYDLSLDYFKQAISMDYDNKEDAYYYVARIEDEQKNFEKALIYFGRENEKKPDDYSISFYLAYFYFRAGEEAVYDLEFEKADRYFEILDDMFTNKLGRDEKLKSYITGYYNLWRLANLNRGDFKKTMVITGKGIDLNEFDPAIIYKDNAIDLTYADIGNEEKKNRKIIDFYKIHADLNPRDTAIDDVYNSIGYYFSMLGKTDSCALYFEKALKVNPDNLTVQMNMMEYYLVKNRYQDVYKTSRTIEGSDLMQQELESDSVNQAFFYFLLANAKCADHKNYNSEKENFNHYIQKQDFSSGWDFTLYNNWINSIADGGVKKQLSEMYSQLLARIGRGNSED